MTFWIIAALLAVAATVMLVVPLLNSRTHQDDDVRNDIAIYKDQLAEVDRDLARGILDEVEAERTRTEIARRILAADKAGQASVRSAPAGLGRVAMMVAVVVIGGGAVALYDTLGRPGAEDLPRETRLADALDRYNNRLSQDELEAEQPTAEQIALPDNLQATVDRIRQTAAENPDDEVAMRELVQMEAILSNTPAAWRAQESVIRITGENASIEDLEALLELMAAAAGGTVSPQSERVLREVLDRNPESLVGLYWAGVMLWQNGRPDQAFIYWDRLLKVAPADQEWVGEIRDSMMELAWYAGKESYTPPNNAPMLRGPSGEDMAAAADMSAEDQQAMIQGMVGNLMNRLANEGGTPEEWAQLIRALGVLGDTERAAAIWGEAQQNFAASPESVDLIRQAAISAGVAE